MSRRSALPRLAALAIGAALMAPMAPAMAVAVAPAAAPAATASTIAPTSYWSWLCYTSRYNLPVLRSTYSSRSGARLVQWSLRRLGYNAGPIDGLYGPVTRRAVRAFQINWGLIVDGVTGPQTWGALQRANC